MSPRIYSLDQHRLTRDRFDPDALWVINKLRRAGFLAYIVGGGVRDPLMGLTPKDADIATSARPGQVRKHLPNSMLIGRRFRLAHVRFGRKIVEVSTFRSGESEGDLVVQDNSWGTPEEDVLRRDFTINGLFYDPFEQTILDYVGGYEDLNSRLLRTIGDPVRRFREDPVRMIRLLKFRSRLNLALDPETESALMMCRDHLGQSSPARILEELLRMLESGAAYPFYRWMLDKELLGVVLPRMQESLKSPRGTAIFNHLKAVDRYYQHGAPPLSRQALFCCLLYPILEHQLLGFNQQSDPPVADVANATREVVQEILDDIPIFPRKLIAQLTHILQHQFRLRALVGKTAKPIRLFRHSEFPMSLEFLAIRSMVAPELIEPLAMWKRVFDEYAHERRERN